ncbi:MAG: hypothetical protein RLZZ303_1270 [Candidatus Hydrogenedentota bacterium]
MKRPAWQRAAAALALGIACAFLLLEGGARFLSSRSGVERPSPIQVLPAQGLPVPAPAFAANEGDINAIHDPDPWVWWRVKPNLDNFRVRILWNEAHSFTLSTDAQGFRRNGDEAMGDRPILVVGDSTAFGVGVDDADTWPARLHALLRAKGEPAAVVNAGVPGHGTVQAVRMAEIYGMPLKPRMVILCAGFNDSGLVPPGELPDLARAARSDAEQSTADSPSRLLHLLSQAVTGAQQLQSGGERARLTPEEYRDALAAAQARFTELGLPLLWVRWPTQEEAEYGRPASGGYPQLLLEHGDQPGVHLIDLLPVFQQLEPTPYFDFVHTTAQGNQAAAVAVAEALSKLPSL